MNAPTRRLDDVADVQVGFAFKSADFVASPGRFRLLRNDNLGHGQTRWSGGMHLNPTEPIDERYQLRVDDIAVAMDRPWIGSGLKYAVIQTHDLPALLVQRVARLRARPGMSQRYLGYVVAGKSFSNYVRSIQTGTAIPHISASALGAYRFTPGQFVEQEALVEVLTSLDDKIAANAELARTITDHLQACVDRTASSARALDEVAAFRNRERRPLSSRERDLFPGKVPYFGAAGQIGTVGGSLFNDPLVLIGEDGSVVKSDKTSYSQYVWGPSWVNNHAHVLTGSGVSTELLYFLLRRAPVDTLTTGAAQPKLSMGNLRRLHVQAPAIDALPALESTVDLEMALLRSITEESRKLVDIRDTLLPHLMSGRLKVQGAEKTVSDAV